jgi:hypothetical protein
LRTLWTDRSSRACGTIILSAASQSTVSPGLGSGKWHRDHQSDVGRLSSGTMRLAIWTCTASSFWFNVVVRP